MIKNEAEVSFSLLYSRFNVERTLKKNELDMLNGSLWDKLLIFALPLALSSILQQLFNSVDVAVVGQFDSNEAVAAVGSNTAVISLIINLFVGLAGGANVVIANYLGRKEDEKVQNTVHGVFALGFVCSIITMFLGILIARPVLIIMDTPVEVLEAAVLYLKIYCLGIPFIVFYNFGAAILRSVGDTKRPLYCLILSGILNALLNLLFVIVFKMSVAGVAVATVISNVVSAVIVIILLIKEKRIIALSLKKIKFHKRELMQVIKIGVPAGIQGMIFSIANIFIQSAVNGFGTDAVAGSTAALNFENFTYYVANAFSLAAATFIGQNIGAGKKDRCKTTTRLCMLYSIAFCAAMSLIFVVAREFFIGLYTPDVNAGYYASLRMTHVLSFACIISTYEICGGALRGLNHSMPPALFTVIGSCVVRIIWIYTVCIKYPTFEVLMDIYPISWVLTGIAVVTAYLIIAKKELGSKSEANRLNGKSFNI